MSKVINFVKKPSYYLNLFESKCDSGDYKSAFSALRYAEKVIEKGEDFEEVLLSRAQGYAEIGRFDRSNEVFYTLLMAGMAKIDSYFGLAQNLYCMGKIDAANFYINKLTTEEPTIELSDLAEYFDFSDDYESQSEYRVVYPATNYETEIASDLMSEGKIKEAEEILEKVDVNSSEFVAASNDLVMCYLLEKRFFDAKKRCEDILQIDNNNAIALCNLAYCYKEDKDEENVNKTLEKIYKIDNATPFDNTKIATTMCEFEKDEKGSEYLQKVLLDKPYIEIFMLLLGISYYNSKRFNLAIDVFDEMIQIDNEDAVAKYYMRYVKEVKDNKKKFERLPYFPQLPYLEMLKRFKYIEEFIKLGNFEQLDEENSFIKECERWLYSTGESELQSKFINALAKSQLVTKIAHIEEVMAYDEVSKLVKAIAFERLFELGVSSIPIVSDNCYYDIIPEKPSNYDRFDDVFVKAYSIAYAILVFSNNKKFDKIKSVAKNSFIKYKESGKKIMNENVLAILFLSYSGGSESVIAAMANGLKLSKNTIKKYKKLLFEE